jgi:DNA mismatch endonuclease (patch repair protein)
MSSIKSRNTKPEMILRRTLWSRGMRYKVNVDFLPGKPDIVFTRVKIAVFCDGDYWHGHNWAIRGLASLDEELELYAPYWKDKILGNIKRDKDNTKLLESEGWQVIRLWESAIKADTDKCANIVIDCYNRRVLITDGGNK